MNIDWSVLDLDCARETTRIAKELRERTAQQLRRRGLVVAISGGIDSSVCATLAVHSLGVARVYCLILPERDSSPDSEQRAQLLASHLGVRCETVDIAPTLDAIGCYRWRDEAIRRAIPAYDSSWRVKIAIDGGMQGRINQFRVIAQAPDGSMHEQRLRLNDYLQVIAATSFKQRIRKTLEYFHADRLNYAVVGTSNRLEYDQGFFVKNGDGSADIKPIAHLYKSQVYAMARHLELPECLCSATPTTDTYSLPQGQDEFYFSLPYQQMDLALWSVDNNREPVQLAATLGITAQQAQYVYDDIRAKRRAAEYLHRRPVLLD